MRAAQRRFTAVVSPVLGLVFACSIVASLAFVTLAAGADGGVARASGTTRDAGPPSRASETPHAGTSTLSNLSKTPPDPAPMSERFQWVFDLRWDRGEIYLLEIHKIDLGMPQPTPRMMGRFALELFEGPTLIERVRFDFPMLGADPFDAGVRNTPRFEPKLKTRIGVLFPATSRGTRLELWDRANDTRVRLPWPPKEGPVTLDGGVP